jgi:polyribonucleotide nucleotidyltransferase
MLPSNDKFPYTYRVVSEITESNGSSSMATVCGTSMSMMDAGVPLEKPIAGIAMGLIKENDEYVVLSDILGDEDHLGDMDFKVAGTKDGITSLQMDIKITSITSAIMKEALEQAKEGRIHILGEMAKAIEKPQEKISDYAPTITTFHVHKDKIREVIGKGGAVIREISETTGAKIEIDDEGLVSVAAVDAKSGSDAIEWIKGIVEEPEIGKIYEGKVVKLMDFGAFVNFMGSKDGLVHISQLKNERVEKVSDVINEGDIVKVKVLDVDGRGKVKLSMKEVEAE